MFCDAIILVVLCLCMDLCTREAFYVLVQPGKQSLWLIAVNTIYGKSLEFDGHCMVLIAFKGKTHAC